MDFVSRRDALKLGGLALLPVLSGCSAPSPGRREIVVGYILVRNGHPPPHTVRVELVRDGTMVMEETVTVAPDSIDVLEATWPTAPAVYELRYAVSGPDVDLDIRTVTITAADEYESGQECAIPAITLLPGETPFVAIGNAARMDRDCPGP